MNLPIVYQLPIWVTAMLFVVVLLGSLEAGYRTGRRRGRTTGESSMKDQGDLVLTSMYALLGLVLAFTYAFTVSRADLRKQAVIDEANAIGTAFLRAALAPEPARTELRKVLLDYAKTRVVTAEMVGSKDKLRKTPASMAQAQSKIWPTTERLVNAMPADPAELLIVQSINEVIDMYIKRLVVNFDQLPGIVFLMVLFLASAALAITGFNAGLSGQLHRWRLTLFALVLAAVMLVISDFDRPIKGFVQVSQQSLKDVIRDMEVMLSE